MGTSVAYHLAHLGGDHLERLGGGAEQLSAGMLIERIACQFPSVEPFERLAEFADEFLAAGLAERRIGVLRVEETHVDRLREMHPDVIINTTLSGSAADISKRLAKRGTFVRKADVKSVLPTLEAAVVPGKEE